LDNAQQPLRPNPHDQGTVENSITRIWNSHVELYRMNNESIVQGGIHLRWVGGFSILAIFHGIANYNSIKQALVPPHFLFMAYVFLFICSISAGLCMLLVLKSRIHMIKMLSDDFNILETIYGDFLKGRQVPQTLEWAHSQTYEKLTKWSWSLGYVVFASFYAALASGAGALLIDGIVPFIKI